MGPPSSSRTGAGGTRGVHDAVSLSTSSTAAGHSGCSQPALLDEALTGFRLLGLEEHAAAVAKLLAVRLRRRDAPDSDVEDFAEDWYNLEDADPARAAYIQFAPRGVPDVTAETTRPPLAERALARARPRRPAVGHPPLLRHPRDDGRRHQPRGRGARLRHARSRSSRPASARSTPGRTHYTLNYGTIELRRALADHLERRYGVRYDPADGAADHGRRVGGGRPRAARDLRPGRRGDPPRAVVRRLRPGRHLRRRRRPPRRRPGSRTTSRSTRRPSRRRSRRARRRCSSAIRATRPAPSCPTTSRTSSPGSPIATTCSSSATRSTTGSPTARTATARSARCPGCASGRSSWAASPRPTR